MLGKVLSMIISLPEANKTPLLVVTTLFVLVFSSCRDPLSDELVPSPSFTPAHVVRIQLEALQSNNTNDQGIAVAFRFASPENKMATGPLKKFTQMLKDKPYKVLLNHLKVTYGPIESFEAGVRQRVLLHTNEGIYRFIFKLSRRKFEPCSGCWLTDSVLVEDVRPVQV